MDTPKYIEIEGPYSFKDVDGLVTPAYIYLPGGEKKTVGKVTVRVSGGMTFAVDLLEEYKDLETASFDVPMRYTYLSLPDKPVNWGFNCLTQGIHHGRPEALWRMPLLQAVHIFTADELKSLVLDRIYTDAMIYVHRGTPRWPQEWAEKVKEYAEELYSNRLKVQVGEITRYYDSPERHRDVQDVVELVKDNRLNSHYEPLHSQDSINMLCRIIGTSASRRASE
jgi:hypothetical protein